MGVDCRIPQPDLKLYVSLQLNQTAYPEHSAATTLGSSQTDMMFSSLNNTCSPRFATRIREKIYYSKHPMIDIN
jgi:hypothetical protein